ncbi:hypothetical protein C8Q80DRAFT_577399 [Daedaleopsis nitida]|nr:hypothetical protein C8Q80DRAFT_577399 [Daedaleopsis nitida]
MEISSSDYSASGLPVATSSVESLPALRHLQQLPVAVSSTYSRDSASATSIIPEAVDNPGRFGYSQLFMAGLWAKSRQITRRLDGFLVKATGKLRALKNRIFRRSLAA